MQVRIAAHFAKHAYCTNWIKSTDSGELAMEKLSPVGETMSSPNGPRFSGA